MERRKLEPGDEDLKGAHQLACELKEVCCGEAAEASASERRQLASGDVVTQGWPSIMVEGT